MYTIKEQVKQGWDVTSTVIPNIIEFIDAACLAGVSGFAIYEALQHKDGLWYRLLLFAGLAIALQAFILLVKHFNYKR